MKDKFTDAKIIVVDDAVTNLKCAKMSLADTAQVYTVISAQKMFDLLDSIVPHLILLDINMPGMDGLEALKILKENPKTADIPVIFLTSKTELDSELEGLSSGAVDYITKPFEPLLLQKRVAIHLMLHQQRLELEEQSKQLKNFNDNLQQMVREETEKVTRLHGAIFTTVVDLVESRDDITGGHISRTTKWYAYLLEDLTRTGVYKEEISAWDQNIVLQSSMLHDVGKIQISDAILKKPGKLTEEEFAEMKLHTVFGAAILDKISATLPQDDALFISHAKVMALTHHEKWDGSGYPYGLSGKDIPLEGRLMAITDVYDALISKRPYKEAFSHETAVEIIIGNSGAHFDPSLIEVFKRVYKKFEAP
ncbi:MAG: response regulator [Deltaproteobacteria bacterium]|jgi:putative two-component system response regulator|nr:response regulator [Deltaproteobacteria bacterium]